MFAILHSLGVFVADKLKSRCRLEAKNFVPPPLTAIALRRAPPRLGFGPCGAPSEFASSGFFSKLKRPLSLSQI
jgi:hypothetical protein